MQDIFPPGVCNLVCGDRDTGAELTKHPIPQLVSITGSTRAGIAVATAAAADLKRAHLELGGKAPVVVFDDADIEAAVEGISVAGLLQRRPGLHGRHAGDRAGGHLRRVPRRPHRGRQGHQDRLRPVGRGHPLRPDQQRQPARPHQRPGRPCSRACPGHDRRAAARATRATSTSRPWSPTSKQDDELIRTEIFGPVLTVQKFSDEDEALAVRQRHRSTASPHRCGPGTSDGRPGWRPGSTSAACGSTRTSRSSVRCRTAGSSTPATARTCRCTGSRTTPASST